MAMVDLSDTMVDLPETMVDLVWEALDSNKISVMLQESPDPLSPYPPRPL